MPEIGDELAAGRALVDLAHQLLETTERDIQGMAATRPGTRRSAGQPL
ncbi:MULTISPECIES: dsRBD fold-containing protein [Streptomyces]